MDIAQESLSQFGAWGVSMAMSITAIIALFQIYKQERQRNQEMSEKVLEAFRENSSIVAKNSEALGGLTNVVERMDNFIRDGK